MQIRRPLFTVLLTAVLPLLTAHSLFAAGPASHVRLPIGEPAPEILATTPDGTPVALAALHGKPIVLQFGSITEPLFRLRTPAVEKLAAKFADKVTFLILYEREAHAADTANAIEANAQDAFDIAAPTSMSERIKLARQTVARLDIKNQQLAIDAWSNTSALRYGNYPNMTFVIDAAGKLQAGYPWMDPKKVQAVLDALLAGKPVPDNLRGPIHPSTPVGNDYGSLSMEMTGYGPGAKLATVIDGMTLSDQEKAAIFPPLSQLLADVRNFRETRLARAGKGGAVPDTDKPASPEDLQAAIQKMRTSAEKFRAACHENLPPNEAKQILDALDQGPAHRLFAEN